MSRRLVLLTLTLIVIPLLTACAADQPQATEATEAPHAAEAPHWGYEGEAGPEHWGELSADYALCATGQQQTPIDLANAAQENAPDVAFDYQAAPLHVLNNGHTIQVVSDGSSSITVGETAYSLAQYHFHTPSEHTLNGESFAAELHLVHRDTQDRLAVVGVMIREGAENAAFAPILANLPSEANQEIAPEGITLDAITLVPQSHLAFEYTGSLTTPPCSEGVSWFVLAEPIEMSAEQIAALQDLIGNNNRPIQPLNGRELLEDTSSD